VWQSTQVAVAYDSDVDVVQALLLEAVLSQDRVLREPQPAVSLAHFGADGLEFVIGYWMADPENGQLNLKSQINIAILHALRRQGIEIPFPQRVLHTGANSVAPVPIVANRLSNRRS
jgi:small-conductance mechanosensitive channel